MAQEIAAPKLGKKPEDLTVIIVHEDSDYGASVASAAEATARAAGFKIAARLPYKASTTDLSSLLLRIRASGADSIINSS